MSTLTKSIHRHALNTLKRKINFFDVSLRDGLQSQKKIYTFQEKKSMLFHIINSYNPRSIELGSLVSSNVLPQMEQSMDLYQYAEKLKVPTDFYLLVPNQNKLDEAIKHKVKNISFISSFSNSFQEKNIKKSLEETKNSLLKINEKVKENTHIKKTKLYLSCFNNCPIENNIKDDIIYEQLLFYEKYTDFNELCLSDTTGNLSLTDFKRLIKNIKSIVNPKKLSLHLHYNDKNKDITKNIIEHALNENIFNLDVSCIEGGGCSVTMNTNELKKNLSYKLINEI